MTETPPDSLIPYDEIVQEALRAVVGRVLSEVGEAGDLPGEHHFYITFKTRAPGVDIPKPSARTLSRRDDDRAAEALLGADRRLKTGFSVGLSFNQVPSTLVVPFASITGFVDPAVNFALQFQAQAEDSSRWRGPIMPRMIRPRPSRSTDGSNVVAVDFKRKK